MMFDGNQISFTIVQHGGQTQHVGFNNVGRCCIKCYNRLAGPLLNILKSNVFTLKLPQKKKKLSTFSLSTRIRHSHIKKNAIQERLLRFPVQYCTTSDTCQYIINKYLIWAK